MKLQKVASLFDIVDNISDPLKAAVSEHPLYMEQIGQVSTNVTICVFPLLLLNLSSKFTFSVSSWVLFCQMFGFLLYMSEYQGKLPSSILSIPKVVAFIFILLA